MPVRHITKDFYLQQGIVFTARAKQMRRNAHRIRGGQCKWRLLVTRPHMSAHRSLKKVSCAMTELVDSFEVHMAWPVHRFGIVLAFLGVDAIVRDFLRP